MSVKEHHVTEFLVEEGFVEDQLAYVNYMLKPEAEEIKAWKAAEANPKFRIMYVVITIRDISCALPLKKNPKFSCEIEANIENKINHLPADYKTQIKKIINVFSTFTSNTLQNIDLLTNTLVKELVDPELTFQKKT